MTKQDRQGKRARRTGQVLCTLLVLACFPAKLWLDGRSPHPAADQAVAGNNPRIDAASGPAMKRQHFNLLSPGLSVPTPAHSKVNHSPSLAALPDGGLAMAWFGGSREGARDVQIFFARYDGNRWSEARGLFSTDGLIRATGRYLTKLGNPVLHAEGSRLNMWFVSVSLGGWGGARLNHSVSLDGGQSWSIPRLLVTSPFLNVSTLVRSAALNIGGPRPEVLLPAYFELSHKYPVLIRLDAHTGEVLDRQRFGGMTGLLQPSLVRAEGEPDKLSAYFRRSLALPSPRVYQADSTDGGLHWSAARPIAVPNGDASVVAWQDSSARWLVANPDPGNRHSIAVYSLNDEAATAERFVPPVQILDRQVPPKNNSSDPAEHSEFSYPSIAETIDGRLHLVYTAEGRKTVRHRIWEASPSGLTGVSKAPTKKEAP